MNVWKTRDPSTAPRAWRRPDRSLAKDTSDALLALLVLLCFFFLAWLA